MKPHGLLLGAAIACVAVVPLARPAQADTASTMAIAGAAAAIVGSILTDANNQPYYVNNGRHVYVSRSTANYYRSHNHSQGNNQGQYHNQPDNGPRGH